MSRSSVSRLPGNPWAGIALLLASAVMALTAPVGCGGGEGSDAGSLDPTPEKLDGSSSHEFEPSDIERAEAAPPEVQEYCAGAVSEAQRIGCLSHVDASEVP